MKDSDLPIYEQIIQKIKELIMKNEMVPGEALPSIRGLAKELSISVITTKRAYEELEKEGLIESIPGKGFYIKACNVDYMKEKKQVLIEREFEAIVVKAKNIGMELEELTELLTIFSEGDRADG